MEKTTCKEIELEQTNTHKHKQTKHKTQQQRKTNVNHTNQPALHRHPPPDRGRKMLYTHATKNNFGAPHIHHHLIPPRSCFGACRRMISVFVFTIFLKYLEFFCRLSFCSVLFFLGGWQCQRNTKQRMQCACFCVRQRTTISLLLKSPYQSARWTRQTPKMKEKTPSDKTKTQTTKTLKRNCDVHHIE